MARIFSTPGVYRREIDKSDILVPTGISNGGIVIRAPKGPINRPVLVTNDQEFIEYFGEPIYTSGTTNDPEIPEFGYGAYASLEFLRESSALYVVRAFTENEDKYAAAEITTSATQYEDFDSGISAIEYVDKFDTRDNIYSINEHSISSNNALLISYIGPGKDGNNVACTVETLTPSASWLFDYDDIDDASTTAIDAIFSSGTSAIEGAFPIASKIFKIKVYEKKSNQKWEDLFSNGKLRIETLEEFIGTLTPMQDDDRNQLFIEDRVNGRSTRIYVKAKMGSSFSSSLTSGATPPDGFDDAGFYVNYIDLIQLKGGSVDIKTELTDTDSFWKYFENREAVPSQILINTSHDTTVKQSVGQVVAKRRDCIAVNQVGGLDDISYKDILRAEKYGYTQSSFMALYSGYSEVNDRYNDRYVWLPNSLFAAAVIARVDNLGFPWQAPAGLERGILPVLNQRKIYNDDHIGLLYDRNINSVKWFRGVGFAIWGQKTAQLRNTALNRINVRRALLYIQNNIEPALQPFVFENNNETTRLQIFTIVDEFLATVQSAGGLTAYDVVIDESNNPPAVIDSNQMNLDIYVQPVRTAEFIQFTTVITRTGISFGEVRLQY